MHKIDHHHLMQKWSPHSREWLSWWSSSPSYAPSYAWVISTIPFPGVVISDHKWSFFQKSDHHRIQGSYYHHLFMGVIIILLPESDHNPLLHESDHNHLLHEGNHHHLMHMGDHHHFIHISEHHHLIHNWMSTCLRENITSFIREHIITLSHEWTSFYSHDYISPSYSQDWKLPPHLVQKPILSLLQNRWTIDYHLPIH